MHVRNSSLLAGLVFDADGKRLTPTYSQKKSKRYRYYVSEHLLDGGSAEREGKEGFRLPAYELEGTVVRGVQEFLADQGRLLDWLESWKVQSGAGGTPTATRS